ncbi:MAG: histidine kinase [Verrucomicrobiota bacterium]|nr:histidine kinase [Verrucomicrobiota bacterium]
MQKIALSLTLAAAFAIPGFAGTHKLPEDKPLATITIPDAWETDDIDAGIEATSDDGEVYLAVETTDAANVKAAMDESIKFFKDKGVTVDDSTLKTQEGKIGDMDVVDLSWDGKDEDGPTKVSVTLVAVTKEKGLLLTYWGSPEGEKKHATELRDIAQSIKKS